MDPKTDKLVKRVTMVATATAGYLLLTADYGPYPNALDPIKNVIQSAQLSVKKLVFGSGEEPHKEDNGENQSRDPKSQISVLSACENLLVHIRVSEFRALLDGFGECIRWYENNKAF